MTLAEALGGVSRRKVPGRTVVADQPVPLGAGKADRSTPDRRFPQS